MPKNKIEIVYLSIDKITPYKNNPRIHSAKHTNQMAASFNEFGIKAPLVLDKYKEIIAGHGKYYAAKQLNIKELPVIIADDLTPAQVKALRVADNKLGLNSSWNEKLLRNEILEILELDEFEIEVTGFETAEIDIIIDGDFSSNQNTPEDNIPEIDNSPAITKIGDIYTLGNHRVICGNSLLEETYKNIMQDSVADIIVCDPPFNVKIDGHVCGLGKIKHREFVQASGEMTDPEFETFLESYMRLNAKFSKDGSIHYHFMDWRGIGLLITAGKRVYAELKNICAWNKDNGGMGSFYRSKHELVAVFKNGTRSHTNNIMLGKYGRYRTNVWDYPGVNTMKKNRINELSMHPTVKPVAMLADILKDASKRGEIVLDAFGGSGSTLIAAEKTGRHARLIELDPKYVDVIVKRWQDLTGKDAVHLQSGKNFNEIANSGGIA